ncbi:hypothetical protein HBH70_151930 [Parastagonospora nodorum]|nr:hypothetical protein HBH53_166990 [Parastagonospora nodorum]KAH4027834.1 hypothetical protein HBI09_143870 [Parastagonospora nodorum]KAH4074290.1 hypothetical protein HBH50_045050 [Parastagonospora nodorum]KAH4082103.1 hypothetical protein HBH48_189970 [Parastagonospora nodorum]KAH4140913.1 hypothetical protein HBH45_079310 [Parastagonospora nodorum]
MGVQFSHIEPESAGGPRKTSQKRLRSEDHLYDSVFSAGTDQSESITTSQAWKVHDSNEEEAIPA